MKEIPSAPDYKVDEYGTVYSKSGKPMAYSHRKDGYKQICLRVRNAYTTRLVHRLVAEAFLGLSVLQVNHKDGDKSNNNVNNLEYVTGSQNQVHAAKCLGKKTKPVQLIKDGIGCWWPSYQDCAKDTGIPRLSVSLLARGVYKNCSGWTL